MVILSPFAREAKNFTDIYFGRVKKNKKKNSNESSRVSKPLLCIEYSYSLFQSNGWDRSKRQNTSKTFV